MHSSILPRHAASNMQNQQLQTIHTNAGMIMSMHQPILPGTGMVCNFPRQQPPSASIQEELYITKLQLQYQRMNQQLQVLRGNNATPTMEAEMVELSFPHVGSRVASNATPTMEAASFDESGTGGI